MSNVRVFIQDQLVITVSAPSLRNRARGRRLVKKASFTAVFTWERAQVGSGGRGARVVSTGNVRMKKLILLLFTFRGLVSKGKKRKWTVLNYGKLNPTMCLISCDS